MIRFTSGFRISSKVSFLLLLCVFAQRVYNQSVISAEIKIASFNQKKKWRYLKNIGKFVLLILCYSLRRIDISNFKRFQFHS